jgi:hypothetical protein
MTALRPGEPRSRRFGPLNRFMMPQRTQSSRVISTLELISKITYRSPCGSWLLTGCGRFPPFDVPAVATRCRRIGGAGFPQHHLHLPLGAMPERARMARSGRQRSSSGGAATKRVALSHAPGAPPRRTWQHTADDVTRQATGVESNHQALRRPPPGPVVRLDWFADKCANDARPGAARDPAALPGCSGCQRGASL